MPRGQHLLAGLGVMVAVAAVTHLAALWLLPRVIMDGAMRRLQGPVPPAPVFSPPTDHRQRAIVMPSPDLAYAVCVWDVSRTALRIRAEPRTKRYWSLALYAAHSDNFFVLNDREAGHGPVELLLVGPEAPAIHPLPPGARLVRSPSSRGLLLMRVLIGDPATEMAVADTARRTLRCESVAPR